MNFWGQKTYCLVTGASRGIGKTIAIEFAKNVEEGSVFVLVARTAPALEETKKLLLSQTGSKCQVVTAALDLEKPDKNTYFKLINSALKQTGKTSGDFDHYILVHNAASLGNTSKKVEEMDDLEEIQSYLTLNITSMLLLNSQFFKIFNDNR
jgi:sepiapterin reductase